VSQTTVAAPQAAATPEHAGYVSALKAHDWSHEFSDDGRVYRRGRDELEQLRATQQRIDRNFQVWNQHCDPQCMNGRAYA
jgi:hypothetical protein